MYIVYCRCTCTHSSEVGVIKVAPLTEGCVVAEGGVVTAVIGHHTTQPVLRGRRITHDTMEYLQQRGREGGSTCMHNVQH